MNNFSVTGVLLLTITILSSPSLAKADWRQTDGPGRYQQDRNYRWDRPSYDKYRPVFKSGQGYSHQPYYKKSPYNDAISYGVKSGRLSRDEVSELYEKSSDIRQKEHAYWSDGYLSKKEREKLSDMRDDYNKDLRHELNDGEKRKSFW